MPQASKSPATSEAPTPEGPPSQAGELDASNGKLQSQYLQLTLQATMFLRRAAPALTKRTVLRPAATRSFTSCVTRCRCSMALERLGKKDWGLMSSR